MNTEGHETGIQYSPKLSSAMRHALCAMQSSVYTLNRYPSILSPKNRLT